MIGDKRGIIPDIDAGPTKTVTLYSDRLCSIDAACSTSGC